jgi:hypothetical protein
MLPIASLLGPLKSLFSLWQDEAVITFSGPDTAQGSSKQLFVHIDNAHTGVLMLALSTISRKPVELKRLELDYSAPLQLFDPKQQGFFCSEQSLDSDRPFRLVWKGDAQIQKGLIQLFAVVAVFPHLAQPHEVRITAYTQKIHRRLGFMSRGRLQVSSQLRSLVGTCQPVMGIVVPPKWSATSPQPYVIESEFKSPDTSGSLAVHETLKDGRTSSKQLQWPQA